MELRDQQTPPRSFPPDNYLAWAIITTILCFWPLGLVSIIKATEVNRKWLAGDYAGALESSKSAKLWAIWAAVIGPVFVIAVIVLLVALRVGVAGLGYFR